TRSKRDWSSDVCSSDLSCSFSRRCGAWRARHEAERPTLVAGPSPTEGSLGNSFEPSSPPYQGPGGDQQADQGPDRQDQQVTPVEIGRASCRESGASAGA